ncbi:MAG: PEP-CTERM sorting domain-containing protein, partial [Verrucomicrobiota bacterium]
AAAGESTWNDAMQGTMAWNTPGGQANLDFVGAASASAAITGNGMYEWSSPGLVLDLQFLVDNPANNFGWFLISDMEGTPRTARLFGSRTHPTLVPSLSIDFTPAVPEPSTAAMLLVGLGVLAGVRRRAR